MKWAERIEKRFLVVISLLAVLVFLSVQARAQDFSAESMAPPGKKKINVFAKQSGSLPETRSVESSKDAIFRQFEGVLSIPVYQTDSTSYSVFGKTNHLHFNDLPKNTDFVPTESLYNHQYGLSWSHHEADGNVWGADVAYGSASDKPFDSSEVTTINGTLTRKISRDRNSAWLFFVNYSNNRGFLDNIPIPGLAYLFFDSQLTRGGIIGAPFFTYWWRPTPEISTSVFILLPSTARTEAGYKLSEMFQAKLKLEYGQQVYMRSGRSQKEERIFYDGKKVATSLKTTLGPQANFEVEIARSFDRGLFNGKNVFEMSSDRLKLAEEWQASLALQLRF